MCFELDKFNFLTSSEKDIRYFTDSVYEGTINESEFNKIFNEIKLNKYSEEEAKIVVSNLVFASFLLPNQRTDYQVPSNEALLHVLSFIDIEGSANLKIIYSIFSVITIFEEDIDKEYYELKREVSEELYLEINNRLSYMSNKDKKLEIANKIENIYKALKDL